VDKANSREGKTVVDPILNLLRHKPGGATDAKEVSIAEGARRYCTINHFHSLSPEYVEFAGYSSWLPCHPVPLDAVDKWKEQEDPWKKVIHQNRRFSRLIAYGSFVVQPKTASSDTPTPVVVAQTALDCTLYAIPGQSCHPPSPFLSRIPLSAL